VQPALRTMRLLHDLVAAVDAAAGRDAAAAAGRDRDSASGAATAPVGAARGGALLNVIHAQAVAAGGEPQVCVSA
jgi:hypothetical protein